MLSADAGETPAYARRYSGYFNAAASSTYQFDLTTDDGSLMWLDGASMVFINDSMGSAGGCGEHRQSPFMRHAWNPEPCRPRHGLRTMF